MPHRPEPVSAELQPSNVRHSLDDDETKKPHVYEDIPGDPFGEEVEGQMRYKTLSWWQCGMLMIAETVSLGILSLPAAVAAMGIVPAIIALLGLGGMATYTGYVIGQFRWRYPHVHSMADAGEVLWGAFGRELLGAGLILLLIFVMGSHLLTFAVAMNTITNHATCTVAFSIVGFAISLLCTLPRTLRGMTLMAPMPGFISILSAVFVVMIDLGIIRRGHYQTIVVHHTDLNHGFLAITNMVFSFAAHAAFFGFMSELKDPKDYSKAVFLLQGVDTSLYIFVAILIYYFAGPDVVSPALGSASPVVRKVAYGVALPTIIISGVVNGHIACKYIYIRLFRGTERVHATDWVSYALWGLIALVLWVLAWVIAEAIPSFSNILSLVASLFATWFTYGLPGIFWLYLNWGQWFRSLRKFALTIVNGFMFCVGAIICGLGLYVSGKAIHETPAGASFSCASSS
ncbi:amino acid transporter [Aspergillus homomorphus CBS 101889]|uniref:Amino acid transporter n=1 Tax=Aspergillus homomorphus (strain CBS 101889) TaxID=1450537 RepID=A0A395HS22_ASPHC|nr:amino acid transporter [Aspergillus homomorphus CBS 101889]RAL10145.1 amino acid transporter [Aspergillus homomorphus CBS 101889]